MAFNPLKDPDEALNSCLLDSFASPGVCEIKSLVMPRKWDEIRGGGTLGSVLRYMGVGLARFTVEITMWTPEHWDLWHAGWEPITRSVPKRPPKTGHSIYHPYLYDLGITEVVVEDRTIPEDVDKTKKYVIPVKFIQFKPWKSIPVTKVDESGKTPAATKEEQYLDRLNEILKAKQAEWRDG